MISYLPCDSLAVRLSVFKSLGSEKHQNKIRPNASNVIQKPITPSTGRGLHVKNVNMGLINCLLIYRKCNKEFEVVKDMLLQNLIRLAMFKTIFGVVTSAEYLFPHTALNDKKISHLIL